MVSSIELNKIDTLENEQLAIVKDDLGPNDVYCLCLKDDINCRPTSLNFRLGFITVNEIPLFVLMVKVENKIYKTLISLDFVKESNYIKNLLGSKAFNLFLFTNSKENFVYRIENKHHKDFLNALSSVTKYMTSNSYYGVIDAKEQLLQKYTDEELWKLAK